jgi:hypothetical protein
MCAANNIFVLATSASPSIGSREEAAAAAAGEEEPEPWLCDELPSAED